MNIDKTLTKLENLIKLHWLQLCDKLKSPPFVGIHPVLELGFVEVFQYSVCLYLNACPLGCSFSLGKPKHAQYVHPAAKCAGT